MQSIVEFLDKSRSALSRTHTTSSAPAPSLTPATIEATTTCKVIIEEILHHEIANPDTLLYVNARDDASLKALAKEVLPALQKQEQVISGYLSRTADESVRVSEKVKGLWAARLEEIRAILAVMADAETPATGLDENKKAIRDEFFRTARRAWEVSLGEVLTQLSKEIVGPFTLGTTLGAISGAEKLMVPQVIRFLLRTCTLRGGLPVWRSWLVERAATAGRRWRRSWRDELDTSLCETSRRNRGDERTWRPSRRK